ncbi:MAG: septation ring formation regulator EzrA, partial [Thomasclavelia spiroformis]
MKILDDLLAKFGSQTVIIVCICILLVIFVTIVYRMFKLKVYRKEIIELENQMNAVKSLPIQYRLGRVKGIGKNMPEVLEKYNLYVKEFDDLNSFQTNDIVPLINEIDEQLYYRKLAGAKSKLYKLKEEISNYETKSQDLLKRIEVITEVENEQRLEIIKIKEKYRAASDNFANVRFKIEDFVPSIPGIFNEIDERFVVLEEMMNNQRFDEAKTYAGKIEKDVDILTANLRDLPTYISIVRKYIPKRLEEIYAIIEEMKEKDFSIEKLSAASRYNQIGDALEQTIQNIKDLKLENVGASIEKMTEDLN